MKRNSRFAGVLAFGLAYLSAPAAISVAGDAQFDAVVHRIKEHYHKGPMPLMGLASFVANRVHPAGVKQVRIAVFEDLNPALHPPEKDFDSFMQQIAGTDFRPMVRVISRRDGEQTFIYARPVDEDYEMLIVTLEANEAAVVKTRISPDAMSRWVGNPGKMAEKPAAHPGESSEP